MFIELRASDDRLRGPKAVDAAPIITAALKAATDSSLDLTRLRVVCDFIQYRQNFRDPVSLRRVEPWDIDSGVGDETYEIAIDLRRAKPDTISAAIQAALAQDDACGRVALEDWGPGSRSLIWGFNSLYWKALSLWEQATGKGYESALPGGESDARNVEAARELILKLFTLWDNLAARRALPEELYVLELGVGNGNQARVFLDELRRLDREQGHGDYYRRLHYLMGDYSPHVLELARKNVAHHAEHVSSLVLDALRPTETLGFLRYKAFLVYISNVYDNLPTDEVVRIGGHLFQVETRAGLARSDAESLAASVKAKPEELPELVARLLRLGPELLSEVLPRAFSHTGRRGHVLARRLGRAAAGRAVRAAGRAGHLRDCARGGRRAAAANRRSQWRPAHAHQQRRGNQLRRHATAAAPARRAAVPRSVRDRHAPVPERFPWTWQVRRFGRQLGQRSLAGRDRLAARLRREFRPIRAPNRRKRGDHDRACP